MQITQHNFFSKYSIKFSLPVFILLLSFACKEKTTMEKESAFFKDFFVNSANKLDKKDIIPLLYDIKYKGKTTGRAVYLGSQFFLTAYHVVDGRINNIELIPQALRSKTKNYSLPFIVLYYDKISDIALLKAPQLPMEEKARLHLALKIPKLKTKVAKFTYLLGEPLAKKYFLDFDGVDFFDKKTKIKSLGQILLEAGSLLYEVSGVVLELKTKVFSSHFSQFHGSKKTSCFSSILTYNGDSGSAVFEITSDGKYRFTGIITHSYGISFEFMTPGHPMGYKGMQQAGGIFSHRDAVDHLISRYLLESVK